VHVLFSETITAASALAARQLTAAGHTVHSCHGPGDLGAICPALRGKPCPLEHSNIDVAVTVRRSNATDAAPIDDGVFCALRRHVPVVVAGETNAHPFARYPHDRVDDPQLLPAAVDAAAAESREHSTVATDEAQRAAGPQAFAVVRRHDGGLHVTLANAGPKAARVAVRVAGVVRAFDPYAKSIDVTAR
jgi:hypothetical protein